jgi:hypothetical protein
MGTWSDCRGFSWAYWQTFHKGEETNVSVKLVPSCSLQLEMTTIYTKYNWAATQSGMGNPNKQHGNKLANQSDIECTGQEWKMSYQYFNRRGSSGKLNLIYVKGLALSTGNASCLLSTNTLLYVKSSPW